MDTCHIYRLLPIQSHHRATSAPSTPSTLPPKTVTGTLTSSICEKSNLPSPPSPSQSLSSAKSASAMPMPESRRPLALELRTFVISDSRAVLTSAAGRAVNKSSLLAAMSTGTSFGALEVLAVVDRFCRSSKTSCRYSAASRSPSFPSPPVPEGMFAASTKKMIPFKFWGLMMLSRA